MTYSRPEDFRDLLWGPNGETGRVPDAPVSHAAAERLDTHGTTVIAVKYRDGVLNVGDRRATAGMGVMFDRAEKVLALDDHTLIAISGSFARALEIVRYLKHAFRYYARRELQEMSLDGKVSEVSRAIAENLPMALQGIGAFIPIVSAYDPRTNEGRIFFYDGMGARFETTEFGAAGSGSERIRGAFDYIIRTKKPFREMSSKRRSGVPDPAGLRGVSTRDGGSQGLPGAGVHRAALGSRGPIRKLAD